MNDMDDVVRTFLELAEIDEVHPDEDRVLAYVKERLDAAGVPYAQDSARNIVARIAGQRDEAIALSGHVDIAAPLQGRKVIVEDDIIRTDGTNLLGGDDKTAVAAMLELAGYLKTQPEKPPRTIELIFSVGEESGMKGAIAMDFSAVQAKQILVLDWMGGVNHLVTQSPAYYGVDVVYKGKDAHPAQWQQGKNAGAALMRAASAIQQGQYIPDVTFNIGIVQIGNARNKVPGRAELKAELRSFDKHKIEAAAKEIEAAFKDGAARYHVEAEIHVSRDVAPYQLDKQGGLMTEVKTALQDMQLDPVYESTYGCFDGNIFSAHGREVIILGAGYYNPHSPDEYVKISELREMYKFLQRFVG